MENEKNQSLETRKVVHSVVFLIVFWGVVAGMMYGFYHLFSWIVSLF